MHCFLFFTKLANERTFLAWVRTSLSIISMGIAITQLFLLRESKYKDPSQLNASTTTLSFSVGMSFILLGMLYMLFGFIRYFHTQVSMTKGNFPASQGIVIFTTVATLIALVALTVFTNISPMYYIPSA
ncbi:hypothetical protein BDB01DRAFT_769326 [Pilobolus umbonatus]|nr:hypothetical protein BDB01DRAFT_769326 [Pilobolus umbonatus]